MRSTTVLDEGITLSFDGTPIAFVQGGAGETALVFVHGISCNKNHWARQLEAFGNMHFVVALDLAGHGASGQGRANWQLEGLARDVEAVVSHLALKRVILIGHSMGGYVIAEAALRLGPTILGLIGVDTWTAIDTETDRPAVAPFKKDFASTMGAFSRAMFPPMANPAVVERVVNDMISSNADAIVPIMESLVAGNNDITATLADIIAPKIAIASDFFRKKDAALFEKHGIDLVKMYNVGHFMMLEEPDLFNRHLDNAICTITAT